MLLRKIDRGGRREALLSHSTCKNNMMSREGRDMKAKMRREHTGGA